VVADQPVPPEIRKLIREMSIANPLWGAPRIHGELLKLGVDIAQTSVAKYMVRRRDPPSQGWRTFLRNPADGIAAMDMFVVPTISFRLLYGFLILGHGRRHILWFGVTAHPTAEWSGAWGSPWDAVGPRANGGDEKLAFSETPLTFMAFSLPSAEGSKVRPLKGRPFRRCDRADFR